MALDMKAPDALPRMAVLFGFCLSILAAANGISLGYAAGLFVIGMMISPVVTVAVAGLFLAPAGKSHLIRLTGSWLLFLLSLAAIAGTGLHIAGFGP